MKLSMKVPFSLEEIKLEQGISKSLNCFTIFGKLFTYSLFSIFWINLILDDGGTTILNKLLFVWLKSSKFWVKMFEYNINEITNDKTMFCCVRYGNVLGSRGSIVPVFVNQIKSGKKITITDPLMTRFNIAMDEALNLIFRAIKNGSGGEVFVPKSVWKGA